MEKKWKEWNSDRFDVRQNIIILSNSNKFHSISTNSGAFMRTLMN